MQREWAKSNGATRVISVHTASALYSTTTAAEITTDFDGMLVPSSIAVAVELANASAVTRAATLPVATFSFTISIVVFKHV